MPDLTKSPKAISPERLINASSSVDGEALTTATDYTFINNGNIGVLMIKSGSGTATVEFDTPWTQQGLDLQQRSYTVPSAGTVLVGPFDPIYYNDTSTGKAKLTPTFSSGTFQIVLFYLS